MAKGFESSGPVEAAGSALLTARVQSVVAACPDSASAAQRKRRHRLAHQRVIFLATVAAWFMAARATARRRDWGLFTTLLAPACMTALALHFAIRAPVDAVGVVKSAYMQFASGPLDAVFGLAVAWSLQKSIRWPLFAALLASLWTVAAYTLYCRLRLPMLPLS